MSLIVLDLCTFGLALCREDEDEEALNLPEGAAVTLDKVPGMLAATENEKRYWILQNTQTSESASSLVVVEKVGSRLSIDC